MRFIFLTMDGNHAAALRSAADLLRREQGVEVSLGLYDATRLRSDEDWTRLRADLARADFVFGSMLFGEEFVRPLEQALSGVTCPICIITSNPALIGLTRLGKLSLQKSAAQRAERNIRHAAGEEEAESPLQRWMGKLRPKGGHGEGKRQLAMLRNLGKLMKHIPGAARDLHTYISAHQYWMHCSAENLRRLLCILIERYIPAYHKRLPALEPIEYPEVALLHPDAGQPFGSLAEYEAWRGKHTEHKTTNKTAQCSQSLGTVGLLSLRTVALSGNTAHLDALYRALEARGLDVRMAYGAGLDFRPAIDAFFRPDASHTGNRSFWKAEAQRQASAAATIDVLLNGAGFSLIGGMAESRPEEARATLEALDVGYLDMIPLSFQRVEEWQRDDTGLSPIQMAMNVAIPELDAAAEPLVYGGPTEQGEQFVALHDQIEHAADRIARRVALRRAPNAEKRVAVVLFNFPPTLGNVGTAAYMDVFASLQRLLLELRAAGYSVDVPPDVESLRQAIVDGNSELYGTDGNVAARLPVSDYMRLFPHFAQIEPFWGRAPGELLNDGKQFYILGASFRNVFVGIQPSFGYERDPMRLLMAKDAAPHHGFAAFYTWLDRVFGAHAVVHFGTHGALEFMPGKQAGMSTRCWPTRLLGAMPNFYYYSVNNPSEATIAKRRGAATLVSYMVPALQQAGLYKGLRVLKDTIDGYRARPTPELLDDIRAQAERLGITPDTVDAAGDEGYIAALAHELILVEQRMIPLGLHVLGKTPEAAELADVLALVAAFYRATPRAATLPQLVAERLGWDYEATRAAVKHDRAAQERWERLDALCRAAMQRFVGAGADAADAYLHAEAHVKPGTLRALWDFLGDLLARMRDEQEVAGLLHALEGGYIAPSPANDVVRNPAVVPTGRNLHGLDPFRVPTPAAQEAGEGLATELLARLTRQSGTLPETIALVLWGTDNLKSDGEGVAQALALLGARPVLDELGKVSDVELLPLAELGRPRIDVVVTVSGIFRDLLAHQMLLLDRAARLAATADEPCEWNFVRKHALAQADELQIGLEEAATRVFSNAPGSYGASVNHLVESGAWEADAELAEAFVSRKSFAYGGRNADGSPYGGWREARALFEQTLSTVDATFQNIDSFEVGVSDIDHYYEYLGGITKSVELMRGTRPPVLVAEALATGDRLSSLEQMVRLEARAKLLNPKWYEAMLEHGYQGVHEIEARVGNTYGWSATAGAVDGWVYQGVADTFLLDEHMRERLTSLNPHAASAIARRLLEAAGRGFWDADEATLAALQDIYGDLEDRLEGVQVRTAVS